MIRTLYVTVFALLLSLQTTVASARKGVGCWRTQSAQRAAMSRLPLAGARSVEAGQFTNYRGLKKGLVILAEFADKKFKSTNNWLKYNDILNAPGYTSSEGFRGSVADYFRDQSAGLFELVFDVMGPYTTEKNYKYYGQNDEDGNDMHAEEMIAEVCRAADADVNFADYDWDGDGEVDEVFVLYAGKGEADTDIPNYIWPHMWGLQEAGLPLTIDGVVINVYACANEQTASGKINGIGTFCHEFSHCLGFPDFYDINYDGLFGMGDFDLMSGGSYGGNGFCPVGYTAYEKMVCGWLSPVVLADEDVAVDSLCPMSEHGNTYIIYNDATPDEYYMIENRQQTGWDEAYPAAGLMITHVDYDSEVWYNNIPNSILTRREAWAMGLTCGNDHQRMTLFHADNDDDQKYWNASYGYHTKTTIDTDLYPYGKCDSLTAESKPAAILFNNNSEGTKLMQGAILDIRQNRNGTMSFRYRAKKPDDVADHLQPLGYGLQKPDIYDLQGRRVEEMRKGIYIVNGRKVVR